MVADSETTTRLNGVNNNRDRIAAGVDGRTDGKSVRQVDGDHPPPEDADHPREDAENVQSGHRSVNRQGTILSKVKDQKDKIKQKANPPGGFDPTPIPDAPPGYTVRFTFHRAVNLPPADFSTGSSDPFLKATLTTSLPKRHKEDPDLVYRTRTIRKTLEPVWDEEWIVANVPSSGFKLKCRMYDEDWPDHDDRLGNVTILADHVDENWNDMPPPGREFKAKKRVGSKRAYIVKACTSAFDKNHSMSPRLWVSAVVLGKSDPPHGHIYTIGPTYYFKHFSPMIGRMTGVKVNKDESNDANNGAETSHSPQEERKMQKYDFQANEIQLAGPVPPKMYHRYVEFRPIIGVIFRRSGLRGRILGKALHHQHQRLYNFDKGTEWGTVKPCSEEASMQLLKMAHFDEGSRTFTYVITLDGLMRFTETGKEFGIDLLSKHTMHSDAAVYIACSGEFLIRRLRQPTSHSSDPEPGQPTHPPNDAVEGGPPRSPPPARPEYYQLIIDNDSGTYRPDKSVLPDLHEYLSRNFPGLGIVTMACDDPECQRIKEEQRSAKHREGRTINMVLNRSPSASSFSSDDVSDLEDVERAGDRGRRSKKERAWEFVEEPRRLKEFAARHGHGHGHGHGHNGGASSSAAAGAAASGETANGPSSSRG